MFLVGVFVADELEPVLGVFVWFVFYDISPLFSLLHLLLHLLQHLLLLGLINLLLLIQRRDLRYIKRVY